MSETPKRRRTSKKAPPAGPRRVSPSPVEYAEGEGASAFATMLGGLIEANLRRSRSRRAEFDAMEGRVGVEVRDLDEAVTLDFRTGQLVVFNGLRANRKLTVSADADTVMKLSRLRLGSPSLALVLDETIRDVAMKLLTRDLTIAGLPFQVQLLRRLTRVLSVG